MPQAVAVGLLLDRQAMGLRNLNFAGAGGVDLHGRRMVRPTGLIEGAAAGAVENEMHDVSLHRTDVGEADVGIGIEQHSKRPRSTVVLGRSILTLDY